MSTSEKIISLETTLQQLKDRFQVECIFNESRLLELQHTAQRKLDTTQDFYCHGSLGLILTLLEKLEIGYEFNNTHDAVYQHFPSGDTTLRLARPEDNLKAEYALLDAKTEKKYIESLEERKPILLSEITSAQLLIKEANAELKLSIKRENEFEKQLAQVTKELLGDVVSTDIVESAEVLEVETNE